MRMSGISALPVYRHLINNDIDDNLHSAYKAGHGCKTTVLYNDRVSIIGRGDGAITLIYLLLLTPLIMVISFVYLRNM